MAEVLPFEFEYERVCARCGLWVDFNNGELTFHCLCNFGWKWNLPAVCIHHKKDSLCKRCSWDAGSQLCYGPLPLELQGRTPGLTSVQELKNWVADNLHVLRPANVESIQGYYFGQGGSDIWDDIMILPDAVHDELEGSDEFPWNTVSELLKRASHELKAPGYADDACGGGDIKLEVSTGKLFHSEYKHIFMGEVNRRGGYIERHYDNGPISTKEI
jgi:hypothetical protein